MTGKWAKELSFSEAFYEKIQWFCVIWNGKLYIPHGVAQTWQPRENDASFAPFKYIIYALPEWMLWFSFICFVFLEFRKCYIYIHMNIINQPFNKVEVVGVYIGFILAMCLAGCLSILKHQRCNYWSLVWEKKLFHLTFYMMTSSNGNIFRVTGHLCGEYTGLRWIPRTKASDAELWCFLWSVSK